MKIIKYNSEARKQLKLGIQALTQAVGSTLGGAGKNVIIDTIEDRPFITADGITVAENLDLEDFPIAQIGIQIVKHACRETNFIAGDGTTTSTVLTNAFLENDYMIKNRPFALVKKGMEKAINDTLKFIDQETRRVETTDSLYSIATISARGDVKLGRMIGDAVKHAGKYGQVMVEEGRGKEDTIEFITGYSMPKGVYSDFYINKREKGIAEFQNPYIFATDREDLIMKDFTTFLSRFLKEVTNASSAPLILICPPLPENIQRLLIDNKAAGKINVTLIEAPEFGVMRTKTLEDLMAFVGGKPCLMDSNDLMEEFPIENLGRCDNFHANRNTTVFSFDSDISERVDAQIEIVNTTEDVEDYKSKRLARLSGKVAKLKVVAASSIEMEEKLHRVEDAKNATKAALEEGYVAGGGVCLLKASLELPKLDGHTDKNIVAGYELVRKVLQYPIRTIINNAYDDDIVGLNKRILNPFKKSHRIFKEICKVNRISVYASYGFDSRNLGIFDMESINVIDPTKVTKAALQSAYSVASTLLSTNCVIAVKGVQAEKEL